MPYARRPNPVFSDEYRVIVAVLVAARIEAGVTQRALARWLGKAASHVGMIERGQRRVDTLELILIARGLGLEPVDLLARIDRRLSKLAPASLGIAA